MVPEKKEESGRRRPNNGTQARNFIVKTIVNRNKIKNENQLSKTKWLSCSNMASFLQT